MADALHWTGQTGVDVEAAPHGLQRLDDPSPADDREDCFRPTLLGGEGVEAEPRDLGEPPLVVGQGVQNGEVAAVPLPFPLPPAPPPSPPVPSLPALSM